MALSERNRRKGIKKAQQLLPGTQVRGYAIGRTGPNPVLAVGGMTVAMIVVTLVLLTSVGLFIFPGRLLLVIASYLVCPPCAVVVADQGVALVKISLRNGAPESVNAVMAHGYVQPRDESLGRVRLMVGNEAVWMTKHEECLLRTAATPAAASAGRDPGQPLPYGAGAPPAHG